MKGNAYAYYVHCFAHPLQLALVAVAKKHVLITLLLNIVTGVVNIVGTSCTCKDAPQGKQLNKIMEVLRVGELSMGKRFKSRNKSSTPGHTP